jgi:hypothetical protein
VVSDLPTPVQGMPLRVKGAGPAEPSSSGEGP